MVFKKLISMDLVEYNPLLGNNEDVVEEIFKTFSTENDASTEINKTKKKKKKKRKKRKKDKLKQ